MLIYIPYFSEQSIRLMCLPDVFVVTCRPGRSRQVMEEGLRGGTGVTGPRPKIYFNPGCFVLSSSWHRY